MSVSVVSMHQLVFLAMPWRKGDVGAACGLWPQSQLYKVAHCLGAWINPNSGLALPAAELGDVVSLIAWYLYIERG